MCIGEYEKTTNLKTKKFRAWRRWSVINADPKKGELGFLHSVSVGCKWDNAEMLSASKPDRSKYNNYGFWCFKELKHLAEVNVGGHIYGEIEISGIIAHHGIGFRAEKAKIISLSCPELAKKYKVKYFEELKVTNAIRRFQGQKALKALPGINPPEKKPKPKAKKSKARRTAIGKR